MADFNAIRLTSGVSSFVSFGLIQVTIDGGIIDDNKQNIASCNQCKTLDELLDYGQCDPVELTEDSL